MLAGSHRNAWPDETGTGGRTNRNTHAVKTIYIGGRMPQDQKDLLVSVARSSFPDSLLKEVTVANNAENFALKVTEI